MSGGAGGEENGCVRSDWGDECWNAKTSCSANPSWDGDGDGDGDDIFCAP